MQYCEVSDVKMEEGSLRCDANISIRPSGRRSSARKTELKNMNSFRGVQRGLEYEADCASGSAGQRRQGRAGNAPLGRRRRGRRISMRSKEEAARLPLFPGSGSGQLSTSTMSGRSGSARPFRSCPTPAKPGIRAEYGLPDYDAESALRSSKKLADFFEESLRYTKDAKAVSNWMMGDLLGYLNAERSGTWPT